MTEEPEAPGVPPLGRRSTPEGQTSRAARGQAARPDPAPRLPYRLLAENANDLVAFIGPDDRIAWVAPTVTETLGWRVSDLVGTRLEDLAHPDEQGVEAGARGDAWWAGPAAMASGRRLRTRDGQYRWMSGSAVPVVDGTGAITGIIVSLRDVDAIVVARRALAESEQRYADLVASLPVGVYVARTKVTGATTFDVFSPRAGILLDLAPGDALADSRLVIGRIHPDDQASLVAAMAAVYRRPRRFAWDGRVVVRGEIRAVRVVAEPGRMDGDELITHGFFEDVTEQQRAQDALEESEERFRSLAELATDLVLRAGPDGRIEWSSQAVTTILGWAMDAVLGVTIRELVHPEDLRVVADATDVADLAGRAVYRARFGRMDGSYRTMDVTVRPILDRAGQLVGRVSGCRDVTEQVEAEAALRDAGTRLAESQRLEAIGRLAGGVAHDFNNLLAGIAGHAELARDGVPADSVVREDLDNVLSAANRAAGLARQLLAFGRRQVLRTQEVDLSEAMGSLLPLLERTLGSDVRIIFDRSAGAGTGITRVDPTQLEEIVVNLALNARDAMPNGGTLAIRLGSRLVTANEAARHTGVAKGRFATLALSDTGRGIPADALPHLFEPFFTTKAMGRGAGLGLATVEGALAQMGGWIEVQSTVGRGSTFTLVLPSVASAAEEIERAGDALAAVTVDPEDEDRRWTILLVEDEDLVRVTITRILRDVGYRVLAVASAEAAIELEPAVVAEVDVLVTDIVMPGMDGAALAAELERRRPGLPAVFISGYAQDVKAELMEQLQRPGTTFLQKPFRRDELAAAVRRVLGTG